MSSQPNLMPVRNPRTGQTDFTIEIADAQEVRRAAVRLRKAQESWGARSLDERIEIMHRWVAAIKRHAVAIVEADSQDTGYGQISRIAPQMMIGAILGGCANAPRQMAAAERKGTSPVWQSVEFDSVLRPYPLVGVISPWNAPTMLSMLHAIPPLIAGCAVLVKPSEVTPRFTVPVLASVREVPEIAEVFDFVLGDGHTGAALVEQADLISFTGSVGNGRRVAEACARRFIPCELELGGKDPLIVTGDADLDDAVAAAIRGAFTSSGQVCFSLERAYVARDVFERFTAKLVERCGSLHINYPNPLEGQLSPFISQRQAEIVDGHLEEALQRGAAILVGGKSFERGGGLYMEATVLAGVTHEMKIMREETFGPVLSVMPFDSVEEAIGLANDTEFGLSAAVIAGTPEEARAIGSRLNAGNISLQDAFLTFAAGPAEADAYGASGVGGKRSGIQRYLRRSALLLNTERPVCLSDQALSAA